MPTPNRWKVLPEDTYIIIKASRFHLRKCWNSSVALLPGTLRIFSCCCHYYFTEKCSSLAQALQHHKMEGKPPQLLELPFPFIWTLERRGGHRKGGGWAGTLGKHTSHIHTVSSAASKHNLFHLASAQRPPPRTQRTWEMSSCWLRR